MGPAIQQNRRFLLPLLTAMLLACQTEPGHVPTPQDAQALARIIQEVAVVNQLVTVHADLATTYGSTAMSSADRALLMSFWAPHLDHERALISYQRRFLNGWQRAGDAEDGTRALATGLVALAAQVQSDLLIVDQLGHSEAVRAAMNETSADYGVSPGEYDAILRRIALPQTILTLQLGTDALARRLQGLRDKHLVTDVGFLELADQSLAFSAAVDATYQKSAPRLVATAITAATDQQLNALASAIVTNIAQWLGDTRLRGKGQSLISPAQVVWLQTQLQPGDVLVERRNWYLSNLGLPGFWPHAELYVGNAAELHAAFDGDADVVAMYGADGLTGWLKKTVPDVWAQYSAWAEDGEPHRILEAISEGVLFSSMTVATQADYLGALRPNLTPLEKAEAIAKAFQQIGKPYDFEFDFLTESVLVCSEVVYVSYRPDAGKRKGITLPLTTVMGRLTLPPNDIVRMFDQQLGTPEQQLTFVAFLDGREATGAAIVATEADLRTSWRRAKWDLSQL